MSDANGSEVWERPGAWRERLKVGDPVIVKTGYNSFAVASVKRFTETRLVVDYRGREQAYMLKTGIEVGTDNALQEATPEAVARVERAALIRNLVGMHWSKLTDQGLSEVWALVQRVQAEGIAPGMGGKAVDLKEGEGQT